MTLRVNGQPIPPSAVQYELERLIRFYSEHMSETEIRRQMDALKEKARQQAIGAKLLIDDSARLDIPVPDEDVQEKLNEIIVSCGGRESFTKLLRDQKASEEVVRAGIRQGRRVDLLVERITAGISDPTEAEMEAHFNSHREEYAKPPRAAAAHILIKVEGENPQERASARAKLEKIRRDVVGGAEFADLAAMYSDCPSGKQSAGDLGWFSPGMMVPEFDKVVFAMAVGELSEILETQFGYHIIRKTDEQPGSPAEFEEVRDRVRDFLRHAARGEAIAAYVADLRAKAVIEDTP